VGTRDPYPNQRPSAALSWARRLARLTDVFALGLLSFVFVVVVVASGTTVAWLTMNGDVDDGFGRLAIIVLAATVVIAPLVRLGAWAQRRREERRWEAIARRAGERGDD
jgi:uncharacterized membrane protein